MEAGDAQPWFYGMPQAFSISRNHPYTTQIPALAALGERWREGVEHALTHAAISAPWRHWAKACLLPWGYGAMGNPT
jgi:hypothetical protein